MTTKLSKGETAFVGCLTVLLVGALSALMGGWMLMLAAGIAHSYIPAVPLLSYWTSVGIFFVARALFDGIRGHSGKAKSS